MNEGGVRRRDYFTQAGDGGGRNAAKWVTGALFAFALVALIVTVSAFQATSEGVAKRALSRAMAALTEIDLLLDQNLSLLRDEAASSRPGDTVALAGFPVDVRLSPEEAQLPQPEVRRLILERAADRLYADGTEALRADAEAAGDIGPFSAAGATDNGLGLLRGGAHTVLGVAMVALTAICVFLAAAMVVLSRGFGRVVSLGAVVLAAALPMAIVSLGIRLLLREAGGDGALEREMFSVAEELVMIPVRVSIAFLGAGLALLLAGIACARILDAGMRVQEADREPAATTSRQ